MPPTFQTKLIVPVRRNATVRRERLLARLNETASGGVGVIRSPAGFGKTTLLVDFCEQAPGSIFWLSLDEWDRDWQTLANYLLMATARGGDPVDPVGREPLAVMAEVSQRLAAANQSYLILDDFHALDGADDALDAIDILIRRLPTNCSLVLATRTSPSVASLAKLRVSGAVTDIGPAELAFNSEEIRQVWGSFQERPLSADHLKSLLKMTDGWPAAVSLACRSGRLSSEVSSGESNLAAYLAAEVVNKLPRELQRFLLRVSVLDVLDGDAGSKLDGSVNSGEASAAIRALDGNGIPLSWLSTDPPRVTLHPLLRDFLKDKLREGDFEQYLELQLLAGKVMAARGAISEAVRHFVAANAWPTLAALIEVEAPRSYRLGRWATILAWLHAMPERDRRAYPCLLVWECRILSRLGRADQALSAVDEGMRTLAGSDSPLAAELETVRSEALRTRGDIGQAIEAARRAKAMAFTVNANIEVMSQARRELGVGLMVQGDFQGAIDELATVLALESERGDSAQVAYLHGVLGSSYGALGRLSASAHHLERAREKWSELGNNKELAWALNNLGVAYWLLGRDTDARATLTDCIARSREGGNRRAEGFALVSIADADRFGGDLGVSARGYAEALAIGRELGEQTLQTYALIGAADVERRRGDLPSAGSLVQEARASAESRGATFEMGLAVSVQARIEHQSGRLSDAIELFLEADRLFQKTGAAKEQAENLLLFGATLLPSRASRSLLSSLLARIPPLIEAAGSTSALDRHADERRAAAKYAVARRIAPDFYRPLLKDPGLRLATSRAGQGHPSVAVVALGGFAVTVDNRSVERIEWEGDKSKELFLLLLLSDRPLTRDEIVENLWPEHPGSHAPSVFHTTLHRARRATYPEAIIEFDGAYVLQPNGVFHSDVRELKTALQSASHSRDEDTKVEALTRACSLYVGALAPGVKGVWLDGTRSRFEQSFIAAAKQLGRLRKTAAPEEAAQAFERVLEIDPYDEDACLGAMQSHINAGDHATAAAIYKRFRDALRAELDQPPGDELQQLYQRVQLDHR